MWLLLIGIFLILICIKVYKKITCGICKSNKRLSNNVAIVTGANKGIGFETAKDFASRGAKVILACRNDSAGFTARDKIIQQTGNTDVHYKHLDLTTFKSVRDFAKDILESEERLDILVNNAGTVTLDNSLTEDNLPIEMQVNYFSPFLLTNLLLPLFKTSAPSRIIVVASLFHWFGKVDLESINKPAKNSFEHMKVYSNSKLCNILFTQELSRRLSGTGVTVNCLHPGGVNTDIFRNWALITRCLIKPFLKTTWEGAQTSIYLAVSPEVQNISGKYFANCKEAMMSGTARDKNLAGKLWEFTERHNLVGTYLP